MAPAAKASIEAANDHVRKAQGIDAARSAKLAGSIAGFLGSSIALDLIDEPGAENLLLAEDSESRRDRFDPLLHAALAQAQARLDRFGFPAPRPDKGSAEQLTIDIDGPHMVVMAQFYNVIDLRQMRRWADARTRRLVFKAVLKIGRSFWSCMPAHWLYQSAYAYGELFPVVQRAISARKMNFDSLWKEALDCAEAAGLNAEDTGVATEIHGIGDRDAFERWLRMQASVALAHKAFENAPATGRIDRRRSAAVRDWARRASRLCADWGEIYNFELLTEQGDFRELNEQAIVLCGGQEARAIRWYFDVTGEGNGELPGIAISLNHETGQGLLEGLQLAIAGQCVFADLRRAMR